MKNLTLYFLLFLIYSFMGWFMEVMLTFVKQHKFVNRGFLIGPYCPIYGVGCLFIVLLLNKYMSSPVVLFFMAIVICSILEYITSYLMEKIFHARWWDYSDKKFNLNGRICLETMIPFGILGCLIIYLVNPFYVRILETIPSTLLNIMAIILFICFLTDNIISFNVVTSLKNEIRAAERDQTEEITKRIKEVLNKRSILHKRLVKAFPNLKTSKELLLDIQKRVNDALDKINK